MRIPQILFIFACASFYLHTTTIQKYDINGHLQTQTYIAQHRETYEIARDTLRLTTPFIIWYYKSQLYSYIMSYFPELHEQINTNLSTLEATLRQHMPNFPGSQPLFHINKRIISFVINRKIQKAMDKAADSGIQKALRPLNIYIKRVAPEKDLFIDAQHGRDLDKQYITIDNVNSYRIDTHRSLLHAAIYGGNLNNVRKLLERGADANTAIQHIRRAITNGDHRSGHYYATVVHMLLAHGASFSTPDNNGQTIYDDLIHNIDTTLTNNNIRNLLYYYNHPQINGIQADLTILRTLMTHDPYVNKRSDITKLLTYFANTPNEYTVMKHIHEHDNKDIRQPLTQLPQEAIARCAQYALVHNTPAIANDIDDYLFQNTSNETKNNIRADLLLHAYTIQTLYPEHHLHKRFQPMINCFPRSDILSHHIYISLDTGKMNIQTFAQICRDHDGNQLQDLCFLFPNNNKRILSHIVYYTLQHTEEEADEAAQFVSQSIHDGVITPAQAQCIIDTHTDAAARYRDTDGNSLLHTCAARPQYNTLLPVIAPRVMHHPEQSPRNNRNETPAMIARRHQNTRALKYFRNKQAINTICRPIPTYTTPPHPTQNPFYTGLRMLGIRPIDTTTTLPSEMLEHVKGYMYCAEKLT